MRIVRKIVLIACAALLIGPACNLPIVQGGTDYEAAAFTVEVGAPAEYRTGPGEGYPVAGVLEPGRQVVAISRNAEGDYLLIRDPADEGTLGWLPSAVALTGGNPFSLPTSALPSPALPISGCPSPVGGGPTPVSCPTLVEGLPVVSGCPSPVGGGPTPVSCPTLVEGPPAVSGCPSPVGGGPTPVSCPTLVEAPPSGGGIPTPVGGSKPGGGPTKVPAPTPLPTTVK